MSTDAGAERHVGPPRTIEIQKFAAARSAEVQALYNAVKDNVESSVGGPSSLTIARHLRRRTTSHNRRIPYWILNERKKNREAHASQQRKKSKQNETSSAPGSSEKRKAERSPPSRRVRRRIEFQRVRQGDDIVQRDGSRRLATHVWHAKRFPMTKCWGYSLPEGLAGRGRGSRAVLKWAKEAAVLHDASYYGLIELQGTSEAISRILQQTVEPAILFPSSVCPLKKAEAHGLLSGNAVLYQFGKAPYDAIAPITFLWRPPSSGLKCRAMDPEQAQANPEQTQANLASEERQLWIWVHPGAYESALQCLSIACERQDKDSEINFVKCRSRRSEFARLEVMGSKATEVIRKVIHPTSRKFGTPHSKTAGQGPEHDSDAPNPGYPADGDFGQPRNLVFFSKAEFLPSSAVVALDVSDPRCASSSCPSDLKAQGLVGEHGIQKGKHGGIQSANHTMGDDVDVRDCRTQDGASDGDECRSVDEDGLSYRARWLNMAEEGLSREVADSEYLWNPQSGAKGTRLVPMSEKKLCKKRHEERKKFLLVVHQEMTTNGAKSNVKDQLDTSTVCPILLLRSSSSMSSAWGWTIIMPIKWVQAFWVPLVFAGGRVIGLRERHWLATNAGIPHFPHDFPDCSSYAQLLTARVAGSNEANRKRPPAKKGPCFVASPLQISILRAFEASNRSNCDIRTDEPVRSCIEAESFISRGLVSQSSEQISCPPYAEKSVHRVEELHDRSGVSQLDSSVAPVKSGDASGECVEVGREDTLKRDGTIDSVGEDDKDGRAHYVEHPEKKFLSFFVARSRNVLLEIFNQCGFQHVTLLHPGVTSRATIGVGLQQETVRWSALEEAAFSDGRPVCSSVNGEEKICYVRVLVSVPRRGVMEEGAVIFLPSTEDRDMFLRSKDWQGASMVQPRNAKRKRKCKEKKLKSRDVADSHETVEGSEDTYEKAIASCEAWSNNRKSIGLVTSSVPRGSTGPCIGFCDVGPLMKLRAAQSGDQRWRDRGDIFVLAGNKYSSKLRPGLISLPLERAEDDIEWL